MPTVTGDSKTRQSKQIFNEISGETITSNAEQGTPPLIVKSTTKVDKLHVSEVTGDVNVSGGTFITSNDQNVTIFENAFVTFENITNIDEFITNEEITFNTFIEESNLVIDYDNNIFNFSLNQFLLFLFEYNILNLTSTNITNNFSLFIQNAIFSLKFNSTIFNISFNDFFFLIFQYNKIDIDLNITNYNDFFLNAVFSLNYNSNIYNITFNNLFLLLFSKTTNINFETNVNIDIKSYKLAINNSTTNYNITVNHLFKYLESIINPVSITNTNIESSFENNKIILNTKANVSFETMTITSDERFKTNIKKIKNEDCLNKINQLEPKEFSYKSNTKKKQYGLIAQDLIETDIRDIVDETDEDHYKVDYNNLFGLLIGSIKELTNEVKKLKNENLELKNLIRKTY